MHENLFHCSFSATHYDETDHIVNDFHIIDLVPTRINTILDWMTEPTYVLKQTKTDQRYQFDVNLPQKNLNSITQIVKNWFHSLYILLSTNMILC